VFAESVGPAVSAVTRGVDGVLAIEVSTAKSSPTGVVEFDGDRVNGLVEKPDDPLSTHVTTGCYLLTADVFRAMRWFDRLQRTSTS
jgi:glucose-1-phosphate thymidylyltransferase